MLHKTLTVVVPTYNMEKYLRRCLDSLIVGEEGMAQLEVLVVNDGSKDSSSAIAHEYEARYADTFRVIDKENGHYGSCVNRGVEEARGRYIKILDADDCYDNAEFEKYVDTIKTVDVDMVLNDYAFIRPDGEIAGIRRYNYRGGGKFQFHKSGIKEVSMHAVAYKTDNLRRLDYRQAEGVAYTDQQWIFTPLFNVRSAYYRAGVLYMYNVGREGQAITGAEKISNQIRESIVVLKAMLNDFANKERVAEAEEWAGNRLYYTMNSVYKTVLLYYGDEGNRALREFDTYFKQTYPTLYEASNERMSVTNIFRHAYLPYWRKNGKLDPRDIIVGLYKAFYRLKMRGDGRKYQPMKEE